jgi:hypothetical protein
VVERSPAKSILDKAKKPFGLDSICPTNPVRLGAKERLAMIDTQLELSLEAGRRCQSVDRRRRKGRAGWWFERMRQVVDGAFDFRPVQASRPEQIWFPKSEDRQEEALKPQG